MLYNFDIIFAAKKNILFSINGVPSTARRRLHHTLSLLLGLFLAAVSSVKYVLDFFFFFQILDR